MNDFSMIIEIVLRGAIAFSAMAIAYVLISFYFPRLIMKPRLSDKAIGDRGIKRYAYENGRAVVYEPEIATRKYVKQYMLFTKDGAKFMKCLLNDKVRYLNYDVLLFNNKNQLIDVINVDELVRDEQMTRALPIPVNTSYVSLVLRTVDNMYVNRKISLDYSYLSCGIYGGLSALCIAISGTLMNSFLSLAFSPSKIEFPTGAEAFVKFLLIGLVFGGLILLLYGTKYRRELN